MKRTHRLVTWLMAVLILAGVIALTALAIPSIWGLPERLHPPLTETELRGLTPDQRLQRQQEQQRLQNDVRSALIQGLVGLLALTGAAIGASVAWRQLQDNRRHQQHNEKLNREQLELSREQLRQALDLSLEELRLTRESQITERFTRAIDQLGNDALDVRLGGIYALERLAHDSPERDHPTVVEVLSAFVREAGTRRPEHGVAETTADKPDASARRTDTRARLATDIQAAVAVLGRLPQQPNVPRGDLSGAWLTGAQLDGAHLSGAQLDKANLSGARLFGANLSDASLSEADLSGAVLGGANLSQASLRGANLKKAWLAQGADLSGADLSRADLSDAVLAGANLSGAELMAANLVGVLFLKQEQLDTARGAATTLLPDGVRRPDTWPKPLGPPPG